jgi:hypothetical protein
MMVADVHQLGFKVVRIGAMFPLSVSVTLSRSRLAPTASHT